MSRSLHFLLSACLGLALAAKSPATALQAPGQAPPLLDRELFFSNPELSGAQLSPDGQYIAFIKPFKAVRNIWVKKTGQPYSAARVVTADPKRPLAGFFWTRDSKRILFLQDKDGDENLNVYAVDPAAPNAEGKEVPAPRNLTEAKNVAAQVYAVPKTDPDTIYVGLNDRDASWHDLYKVKISTGERTLVRKNTERIAGWIFDSKGQLRLAQRLTEKGETEILRADPDRLTTIYTCGVLESTDFMQFHKDGKRIYLQTNKGNRNLSELVLFDPATGREEKVESDPRNCVDFGGAIFSELTDKLLVTSYMDDRLRVYFHDKAWEADYKFLQKKFPGMEITIGSMTADESKFLVKASSDADPGTIYHFDRKSKKLSLEYVSRESIPRGFMAPMRPIRYKSSDGLEIPAYLTLPKGLPAKNLPLVVVPHGGPWMRDTWGFNGEAQFLANRGYAVLQPNFRASTGYGKKFLNAGNKQWGALMQDDLTWGVKHLVKTGLVDAKRVGIMGGSYGGYAALAGAAFTPDLFKAAVPIVGPSNLLTLLDTIPPYWEAGRVIFHTRMGDPTTPEGKEQLKRQSPLFSADKIKTPLLVVQGANDPRVKKAESDQIVIALRDRNFPVEYLCAPDEGHGFHRPVNNMAMHASAEKFLAKHLGGRFQEGGTPEVLQRLKEITVDPKTVSLTTKAEVSGIPVPAADLGAFTAAYKGTLSMQGRELPFTLTREVTDAGGQWRVQEMMDMGPMGQVKQVFGLEKGTLKFRKLFLNQGPFTLDLAFGEGKIAGSVAMGGEPKVLSLPLVEDIYGDHEEALARLPLAEGYTVVLRGFDAQKQRLDLKRVTVAGVETLKGQKAWRVEIVSAEGEPGGQTLWITQISRRVLKTQVLLPEMGNATMTTELQ